MTKSKDDKDITKDAIKALRETLGESQTEFAGRFRVNQSTVARWETKGPPRHGTSRFVIEQFLDVIRDKKGRRRSRVEAG